MIANCLLVMNGKGGVGKTSVVANVGGLAAANGWRVLVVDTDPQGNLARDLGVIDASDDGANLRDAVLGRAALAPTRGVRPGLDLAAGGMHLESLPGEVQALMARGQYLSALGMMESALRPCSHRYDLILIDSPPGERAIQMIAARAAHHLVIPTAPDDCSIDGLASVWERVGHLRTEGGNPDLNVLGVVVTLALAGAAAVRRDVRASLRELLGEDVPVLDTMIRFAQTAALDCRRMGRLAHEYESAAVEASPWWQQRRTGTRGVRYSTAASGLAGDYQQLTDELLGAYARHATLEPKRRSA